MKGTPVKYLMKTILCAALVAFVLGCQNTTTQQQPTAAAPKTDKEKISYAIGTNMAQSIADIRDEIDLAMLQKGISDKILGKEKAPF